MSSKRNKTVGLSLSVILALSATACSSQESKPAPSGDSSKPSEKQQPLNLRVMMAENAGQPILKDSVAIKEIQKKLGVTIDLEPVPGSNYTEKKRTLIATNNIPDIIRVDPADIKEYAHTGIFLPVSDYIDKYAPNFKKLMQQEPEMKKIMVDGKLYGFPVMANYRVQLAPAPVMRTDLLKQLNLKAPETFDELYTVLKKFKEAHPTSYPMTIRNGTRGLLGWIAYPLGSGFDIYYDKDAGGKWIFGPATPEFRSVLAYLNKLYSEKLLDPDYATNTAQIWQEKLGSGKSFFFYDNNSFAINFNKSLQASNKDAKFEVMPLMKNEKGQKRNYKYAPHWWSTFAISSKVKNPEEVVKFMDWLYSEEGVEVTNFGIQGEHFTKENGKYKVSDSVLNQYKDKQDPLRSMQSALGTGLLAFSAYINETPNAAISPPDLVRWAEMIQNEKAYDAETLAPPFNKEESDKIKQIKTQLDTMVNQEMDKFIMGVRPLSEYDAFIKQLRDKGATELEKIYNDANARLK